MFRSRNRRFTHKCRLRNLDDDPIIWTINQGWFVGFRRWLFRLLLPDFHNPEARSFYKSNTELLYAQNRQRHLYRWSIHPFSILRMYWEYFLIIVYWGVFLTDPINGLTVSVHSSIAITSLVFKSFFLFDVFLNFVTGYLHVKSSTVVLARGKIAKHYLCGFFLIDFLTSIPISYVLRIFSLEKDYYRLKLIMVFRLLRMPTYVTYQTKFLERRNVSQLKILMLSWAVWIFNVLYWGMLFFYLLLTSLGDLQADTGLTDTIDNIVYVSYEMVRLFMLVGTTNRHYESRTHAIYHALFQITTILIGAVTNMIILAAIFQIRSYYSGVNNKYGTVLQQINEFMNYKELPLRIRKRVIAYVDFKFQRRIFKEGEILKNLSTRLREEVLWHNCQHMLRKVEFFKKLPIEAMQDLLHKLRSTVYMVGDVIIHSGLPGKAIYFIYMGAVVVFSKNGKEICHLGEGDHFGEIALLLNDARVATVVAIKECEILEINKADFLEISRQYPQAYAEMRQLALSRLELTMTID